MKHLLLLIILIILSTNTFAIKTDVKGFIALDILKLYKKESKDPTFQTGIGTLDIKFYAYHDNMSFKLKVDLDDGDINEAYNIFEEANATYRVTKTFKITAGKGVVPFHQKRYGVLESSYIDGGSGIGGTNSWRDQDNKLLITVTNGSYKTGHMNHLTVYGESNQIVKNKDGSIKITTDKKGNDHLEYKTSKSFKSDEQRGISDKLEFFIGNFTIYGSGIYYFNDHHPIDKWAVDTGGRYREKGLEIWWETMYGFYSTHYAAEYAAFKQYEKTFQVGGQIYLNEKFDLSTNIEAMFIKKATWDFDNYDDRFIKFEIGPQYKIRKNAFITYGAIIERKKSTKNNVVQPNVHLFGTALKLSFWY